jgi:hypothetical protein
MFVGVNERLRDHHQGVQAIGEDAEVEQSGVSSGILGTMDHQDCPGMIHDPQQ